MRALRNIRGQCLREQELPPICPSVEKTAGRTPDGILTVEELQKVYKLLFLFLPLKAPQPF